MSRWPRRRRWVLVAIALLGPSATPRFAAADADEASLALGLLTALVAERDPLADSRSGVALGVGAGLRFTYATDDRFAYELRADYAETAAAHYGSVELDGVSGDLFRNGRLVRLGAGVTARFGVRFIPTLGVGAAYQLHIQHSGRLVDPSNSRPIRNPDFSARNELVLIGAAGCDYRFDRHLVGGVTARAVWSAAPAQDFAALELIFELSYYWYPR
jgi:hypothetical protein